MTILRFSSADRRQEFGGAVFVQAVDPKLLPALFFATRCESCWSQAPTMKQKIHTVIPVMTGPLKAWAELYCQCSARKGWDVRAGWRCLGFISVDSASPKLQIRLWVQNTQIYPLRPEDYNLHIPVNKFHCLLSMLLKENIGFVSSVTENSLWTFSWDVVLQPPPFFSTWKNSSILLERRLPLHLCHPSACQGVSFLCS